MGLPARNSSPGHQPAVIAGADRENILQSPPRDSELQTGTVVGAEKEIIL